MKLRTIAIVALMLCAILTHASIYLPDDNLEQYVIDQGLDDELDDYVEYDSLIQISTIYMTTAVLDMTGFEYFDSLVSLNMTVVLVDTIELHDFDKLEFATLFLPTSTYLSLQDAPLLSSY